MVKAVQHFSFIFHFKEYYTTQASGNKYIFTFPICMRYSGQCSQNVHSVDSSKLLIAIHVDQARA